MGNKVISNYFLWPSDATNQLYLITTLDIVNSKNSVMVSQMKTMSDDICMIKEQFPENTFSEAASSQCSKI